MRVWIARRRQKGAIVPLANSFLVEGASEPVEVIVREGTDQGQRKAGRVARAYIPGTQRILAELSFPRLVRLGRQGFVLTGIERELDGYKQPTGFAQSWVCQLASPLAAWVPHKGDMFFYGQPVPRSRLRDRQGGCSPGDVELGSVLVPELGRFSQVASFRPDSGGSAARLLDAELRWMAEDSFALVGTHISAAHQERPEKAYEGGWLCSYFPPEPTGDGRGGALEVGADRMDDYSGRGREHAERQKHAID